MQTRTPNQKELLEACRYSNFKKIKNLLAIGTNPQFDLVGYPADWREMQDYETPIGEIMCPLYSEEHVETVRALLDAGADVNSYTHHTASQARSTPLGRALLANRADSGMTTPEIQQKVVDLLLSRGAQVNFLSEEDLVTFMEYGNSKLLESLLDAGLNPSKVAKGKTILECVISASTGSFGEKRASMAKLLIKRGANLAVKDGCDKSLIQRVSRPDIVALLLEEDAHILDGMTLHDHVILESPEFVQKLIARGDDLNSLNGKGNTPLMETAHWGFARAAFILINAGAKLNIHNQDGETALHLAFANAQNFSHSSCDYTGDRRFPILLELYSKGAIPHLDKLGRTPLMRCHVASKDYAAIRFCIDEFSHFEAQYYSFDGAEYAKEMMKAYQGEMGHYAAFERLPKQESPKHLFLGRLVQKQPLAVVATLRENAVKKAIKDLLIAVKANNEVAASLVLNQFPEIDVNVITDEEGVRPLSIAIRSVTPPLSHRLRRCE